MRCSTQIWPGEKNFLKQGTAPLGVGSDCRLEEKASAGDLVLPLRTDFDLQIWNAPGSNSASRRARSRQTGGGLVPTDVTPLQNHQ
jgi:hypothetical protein